MVGVVAAIYVGALVYGHSIGEPALPVQINTLVIVAFAGTLVALFNWLTTARAEERTAKRLAPAQKQSVVGVVPVHQIGVSRPRVVEAEWAQNDATVVLDVRTPPKPRRKRRTRQSPAPVPGLDAEVIELGRRITNKIDRTGA